MIKKTKQDVTRGGGNLLNRNEKPLFVVKECRKTHYIKVRAANTKRSFKMVQDTGSENTYIDQHMANAWGLMRGRVPTVPYKKSTTIDSNGTIHKSVRLDSVSLEILCPDGIYRGSTGPVEVNIDQRINRSGRLYGVSHIRTLGDTVRYILDFTRCKKSPTRKDKNGSLARFRQRTIV